MRNLVFLALGNWVMAFLGEPAGAAHACTRANVAADGLLVHACWGHGGAACTVLIIVVHECGRPHARGGPCGGVVLGLGAHAGDSFAASRGSAGQEAALVQVRLVSVENARARKSQEP